MDEETTKADGARTLSPGSMGTQCAGNVSTCGQKTVIIGSPFVRTGSIRMDHESLRIDYQAFGADHVAYVEMKDLQRLVRDRFAPAAPVKQIRLGIDGAEITEKIGHTARTSSGKAVKIQTISSGGDMVVPWTGFVQVVNKKIKSAALSRIRVPEAPQKAPERDIRAGLERGF